MRLGHMTTCCPNPVPGQCPPPPPAAKLSCDTLQCNCEDVRERDSAFDYCFSAGGL